jgi:hypothetical protein
MYIYLKSVAISFRLCVFAFLFISISSRSSKILIVSLLVGEALVGSSKIKNRKAKSKMRKRKNNLKMY